MNATVNDVVLTPKVCSTLHHLQDHGADLCCECIDKAIGLVLDLRLIDNVPDSDVLTIISDLRLVASYMKELVPEKKKGGAQ